VPVNKKVNNPDLEIGAPLQGKLSKLLVRAGDTVASNAPLFIIEAMKMETTVTATRNSKVKTVHLPEGTMVQQDDVVVEFGE
jgi:pyruvate carboxylase